MSNLSLLDIVYFLPRLCDIDFRPIQYQEQVESSGPGCIWIHPKQVYELHSISDYYKPLMEFKASLPPEERVVLAGHSLGGLSLSAAMERFPDKVSVAVFATADARP
ncbi:hypothetical protein DITRI_Ditri18aG0097400 [Diplodiscus trichospermus]